MKITASLMAQSFIELDKAVVHVIRLVSFLWLWFSVCLLGEGNGTPLQYSCLENPMDGGACSATVHGGHKELDRSEHTHMYTHRNHCHFLKFIWLNSLEQWFSNVNILFCFCFCFFLAVPHGVWDLTSTTRDELVPLHWKHGVLTTILPESPSDVSIL